MNPANMNRFTIVCVALCVMVHAGAAVAAAGRAGEVKTVRGFASAASDSGSIRKLEKGNDVNSGETIVTSSNNFLRMQLTDGGYIVLRPNTRFQIEDYNLDEEPTQNRGFFNLVKGGFRAVTGAIAKRNRSNYKFRTSVATIGIRGTDLEVLDCTDGCPDLGTDTEPGVYLKVHQGEVDFGSLTYGQGQDGFGTGVGDTVVIPDSQNPLTNNPTGSAEPCPN